MFEIVISRFYVWLVSSIHLYPPGFPKGMDEIGRKPITQKIQ